MKAFTLNSIMYSAACNEIASQNLEHEFHSELCSAGDEFNMVGTDNEQYLCAKEYFIDSLPAKLRIEVRTLVTKISDEVPFNTTESDLQCYQRIDAYLHPVVKSPAEDNEDINNKEIAVVFAELQELQTAYWSKISEFECMLNVDLDDIGIADLNDLTLKQVRNGEY